MLCLLGVGIPQQISGRARIKEISAKEKTLHLVVLEYREERAVFSGSATPIPLSPEDRTRANVVFDHWGQSIDAYEQSLQVSAFSSKFDDFLKGSYKLTADEMAGLKLFHGKGNCNSCHLDGRGTTLKPDQTDTRLPV